MIDTKLGRRDCAPSSEPSRDQNVQATHVANHASNLARLKFFQFTTGSMWSERQPGEEQLIAAGSTPLYLLTTLR